MAGQDSQDNGAPREASARIERLKQALRHNLKRRKAQQRGRSHHQADATHDSAGIAADKPKR